MRFFITALFVFVLNFAFGQYIHPEAGVVFTNTEVPRVDVYIEESFLDNILHPDSLQNNTEYPATFIFSSSEAQDTIEEIGFRLRGNTSRTSGKKSFKISFNTFQPGRKYHGLEKLNLNGEHNDPSIIRAKLSWDLFNGQGVPSSRSNHVAVYINEEYKGLYINVEHVDEEFVQSRMDDGSGNLWKCLWPADLKYKGSNPLVYAEPESWGRRAYDLRTNVEEWDYTPLAEFIDVLNNTGSGENFRCALEEVFDVENYLKVIAMDILIGNWDGPMVNKNNFYLYHNPSSGRITYIPYDLDNTFGIDWFGVQWSSSTIYDWSSYSGESRPIYDKIISDDEYRKRVSYYFDEILNTAFNTDLLYLYLDDKLDMIKSFRVDDVYAGYDYGYTYDDFLTSYNFGLWGHAEEGLKQYVANRQFFAQDELVLEDFPIVLDLMDLDWTEENITFRFNYYDPNELDQIEFRYSVNNGPVQTSAVTVDGSGVVEFSYVVSETGFMDVQLVSRNINGEEWSWPRCDTRRINLGYQEVPNIVINEFMASNSSFVQDEYEEFDDWIEIHNPTNLAFDLGQLYLSDNPNERNKWRLPNEFIGPQGYVIIWADSEPSQGENHSNFKLKSEGEFIGLFDRTENNFAPIDGIEYPAQNTDQSYARIPNGSGDFQFSEFVTFGSNNDIMLSTEEGENFDLKLFPNPTLGSIQWSCTNCNATEYWIHSTNGQVLESGKGKEAFNTPLPQGVYILKLRINGEHVIERKVIKL